MGGLGYLVHPGPSMHPFFNLLRAVVSFRFLYSFKQGLIFFRYTGTVLLCYFFAVAGTKSVKETFVLCYR